MGNNFENPLALVYIWPILFSATSDAEIKMSLSRNFSLSSLA